MAGTEVTGEVADNIADITEITPEAGNNGDEQEIETEPFVTVKGIEIPLYKNGIEKTQDFVKRTLHVLFDRKLLPETEIEKMLDKDYSKETFGIQFPIIQNDTTKLKDGQGYSRYWSKEMFGNKYFGCSQWWKDLDSIYERKLAAWIKKIAGLNKA